MSANQQKLDEMLGDCVQSVVFSIPIMDHVAFSGVLKLCYDVVQARMTEASSSRGQERNNPHEKFCNYPLSSKSAKSIRNISASLKNHSKLISTIQLPASIRNEDDLNEINDRWLENNTLDMHMEHIHRADNLMSEIGIRSFLRHSKILNGGSLEHFFRRYDLKSCRPSAHLSASSRIENLQGENTIISLEAFPKPFLLLNAEAIKAINSPTEILLSKISQILSLRRAGFWDGLGFMFHSPFESRLFFARMPDDEKNDPLNRLNKAKFQEFKYHPNSIEGSDPDYMSPHSSDTTIEGIIDRAIGDQWLIEVKNKSNSNSKLSFKSDLSEVPTEAMLDEIKLRGWVVKVEGRNEID